MKSRNAINTMILSIFYEKMFKCITWTQINITQCQKIKKTLKSHKHRTELYFKYFNMQGSSVKRHFQAWRPKDVLSWANKLGFIHSPSWRPMSFLLTSDLKATSWQRYFYVCNEKVYRKTFRRTGPIKNVLSLSGDVLPTGISALGTGA